MTIEGSAPRWTMTLYVSGAGPRSSEAIAAVRLVCDSELAGLVDLAVVNAADHPDLVVRDRILALPTLVKHAPEPRRWLVGNLDDATAIRSGLDLGGGS